MAKKPRDSRGGGLERVSVGDATVVVLGNAENWIAREAWIGNTVGGGSGISEGKGYSNRGETSNGVPTIDDGEWRDKSSMTRLGFCGRDEAPDSSLKDDSCKTTGAISIDYLLVFLFLAYHGNRADPVSGDNWNKLFVVQVWVWCRSTRHT